MATTEDLGSGLVGIFGLENISGKIGMIGTVLLWFIIFIVFALIIGGGLWWLIRFKQYNQKIKIYGLVGNKSALKYKTKGRFLPIGRAGDKVLVLKKPKGKTLPYPTIQMGKKEWWYWEREDGELINFSIGDLDEQFKKAGAYYVHTDMRMERLGIEKNLYDRLLKKESFWQKHGATLINVLFIVIICIMLIVLFTRMERIADGLSDAAGSVSELARSTKELSATNPQRPSGGDIIPVQTILSLLKIGVPNGV